MRVLRRPMFRSGGSSGEGITSGLVPRQGYADPAGQVNQLDDLAGLTIPQMREVAQGMAYRPRGRTPADALIEFGLNLASAPPSGSIFSTAAGAAKEPFQRYAKSKAESEAARYMSEADMFRTLIGAQAKLKGGEGGAQWQKQWEAEQIPGLVSKIAELEAKETLTEAEKNELQTSRLLLDKYSKEDPFVTWFLKEPKAGLAMYKDIKSQLKLEDEKRTKKRYDPELGDDDPTLISDSFREFRKRLRRDMRATGGRVGYQQGLSVDKLSELNKATVTPFQEPPQMEQAETMPEELTGITYEELRRRLPTEVSDEIVRLLVSSAEAMEDFAMIQTEEDVANFNQKYSVELVLPSEV